MYESQNLAYPGPAMSNIVFETPIDKSTFPKDIWLLQLFTIASHGNFEMSAYATFNSLPWYERVEAIKFLEGTLSSITSI